MENFAGIGLSLESPGVCVVDASGRVVREAKVASEPEALIAWFRGLGLAMPRIGLEAGPLSQWLYAAMCAALFLIAPPAEAYTFIGAGADTCGTWIADRNKHNLAAQQDEQWILGYLSGVGERTDFDPLKGLTAEGVYAWVDNYCQANFLARIKDAAVIFVRQHPGT